MTIDYPWYTVLLCLLAGAVYTATMYFVGRQSFSRRLRWLLSALRFVAVTAIALLLLAPLTRQSVTERQLPQVVVAQDLSGSVTTSADSSFSLTPLIEALEGKCHVISETFGSTNSTDIGALLECHRHDNLAALVVATDGIHNRGTSPTSVAEHLSYPIYPLALGDTVARRDAVLSGLRCNRIAMPGNTIPVEVTVGATLLNGHATRLHAIDNHGALLRTLPVVYQGDDYSITLTFELDATEPGLQRFRLQLDPVEGEQSLDNNVLTFFVDVIDSRRHVVIVGHAPHPDLGALKQAIESNPSYEAEVVMAEEVENGKWKANEDVSLFVLHNLPSTQHPSMSFANELPHIFVVGMQTDLPRFNALRTGLEIVSNAHRANEVTALFQPFFSLFSIPADDAAALESLPPLTAPFGEARTNPSLQTLFMARLGRIDTRQPLIAASSQGRQRIAIVWGEGLWRWRLADYQTYQTHAHVDRLLSQLVTFASLQSDRQRLRVESERSYEAGESVLLRAELYNEAFQLTQEPDIKLHLASDSLQADYTFRRSTSSYSLGIASLPEGLYHYRATTEDGLSDEGHFAVESLNLEQQQLTANHSLLATLAALTGGKVYTPSQLDALASQLNSLKPTLYSHTRYAELLRMPLALLLILLLLSAEWVLRKYHGEI